MKTIPIETLKRTHDLRTKVGPAEASKQLGISRETVVRYSTEYKHRTKEQPSEKSKLVSDVVLKELTENFTMDELRAIARGGRILPGVAKVPIINFDGELFRIGAISDTHVGHKQFNKGRLFQAFEQFKKENVNMIVHAGDVTEGMSHRPGHVYELDNIGYAAQKDESINIFGQWNDTDIYMIDGNHDRWYIKSNGAYIVRDICEALPNAHFIGHDEGDISLNGNASVKLWHGEDGSSYALSYRLQKIIESLSGGEKPDVLICGHVHKFVNIFERNVHCISTGCIEAQTKWMRGKRIAAHVGFTIIDVYVNKDGVSKCKVTWYPFYV